MDIKALKDKILQLAIQGKLVEQDVNDESATVLLGSLAEEKERLIRDKKIKKEKPLPEIKEEEKVFDLPKGWVWVRLGDLGIFKKGPFGSTITKSMFVPKSQDTIKVYEQKNAIKKDWKLGNYYVSKDYFESNLKGFEVFEGDVIVSCAGTIGETYIMPKGIERGVINQALMRMKFYESININYFLLYFDFILKATANESSKGSAIKNIPPFDIFKKMLISLPPFEEQKRIVEKVDELFKIIDELDNNKQDLLQDITDSRNKILHLAIRGKLVEQDEKDEPASVLLERILESKEKLIKEKKIKKEQPLPEITDEEIPFHLPNGWKWARLIDVSVDIADVDHKMPKEVDKGVPYVSPKDFFGTNGIDFKNCKKISLEDFNALSKKIKPEYHDIIFPRYGTIGVLRYVETDIDFLVSYSCATIKTFKEVINSKYILYYLQSEQAKIEIDRYINKTTQPNVGLKSIKQFILPIPPLSEQNRIVEKVDMLMAYLDTLKEEIELNSLIE